MEALPRNLLLNELVPLLTFLERQALGGSCLRLREICDASFKGLPLHFPDKGRASDRQLLFGFDSQPGLFEKAVKTMLAKGAHFRTVVVMDKAGSFYGRIVLKLLRWSPLYLALNVPLASISLATEDCTAETGQLMAQCAGLENVHIYNYRDEWDDRPCDLGFLRRLPKLCQLSIKLPNQLSVQDFLADVPVEQLLFLRIYHASADWIRELLSTLPSLPLLSLLGFSYKNKRDAIAIPWAKFPALQHLLVPNVHLLDAGSSESAPKLLRIAWGNNECDKSGVSLTSFLAFLPKDAQLRNLALHLSREEHFATGNHVELDALPALPCLSHLSLSFKPLVSESTLFPRLAKSLGRLPAVTHLVLITTGAMREPREVFLPFKLAALFPLLRRFHLPGQLLHQSALTKCRRRVLLSLLSVLAHPRRPRGLSLTVRLRDESSALQLREAASKLGSAADLLRFDWDKLRERRWARRNWANSPPQESSDSDSD